MVSLRTVLARRSSRCRYRRSKYRAIPVLGLAIVFGWMSLISGCHRESDVTSSVDPVALMLAAIDAGDWQLADQHSKQVLIANRDDPDLLTKVAAVSAYCDRKREAAHLLADAARLANFQPASRVDFAIQALIDVGEVYPAIELLEESLDAHPERDTQRRMLVGFWGEVQRTDQIAIHLKKLIQRRDFDLSLLASTTETSSRRFSDNTAARMMERNPDDHRVRLAEAFLALHWRDAVRAAEVLEDVLKHHPDFAPAHAMYGQALASASRWDDLPAWLENTPSGSSDFAEYWLTLGDMATENGRLAEGSRAYWEATRRDPDHNGAWDRLRLSIHRLRASDSEFRDRISDEQLEVVNDYANAFLTLREQFNEFNADGQTSQTDATNVARALVSLGRIWEAEAWSAAATTLSEEPSEELAGLRDEIVGKLRRDSSWFATSTPAMSLDFSFLPAPRLDSEKVRPPRSAAVLSVASQEHLRMSELSDRWGLRSIGEGNNPTDPRLGALIRSTGVGGGAIDFDLDGLPDLLVMNAGGTMLQLDSMPNELMRNIGDQFRSCQRHGRRRRSRIRARGCGGRLQRRRFLGPVFRQFGNESFVAKQR